MDWRGAKEAQKLANLYYLRLTMGVRMTDIRKPAEPIKFRLFKVFWDRRNINVYVADNDHDVFIVPKGMFHVAKNPGRRKK